MAHRTFFKTDPPVKAVRRAKVVSRQQSEKAEMLKVRRRDGRCRVPGCGCAKAGLVLDVSHGQHRGMGGNPAGDRTTGEKMILVCRWRHRLGRVALDRGTLKYEALDPDVGTAGPVRWFVDPEALGYAPGNWLCLGETGPRKTYPMTPQEIELAARLAKMDL